MKKREILPNVFVSVTYDSKKLTALYYTNDGRVLLRSGGPRNWRFNNPGNIDAVGSTELQKGRIGKALVKGVKKLPDHLAAIFESYEAGCRAQVSLLRRKYKNNTISEMTEIYSPASDGNDPAQYAKELLKETGVSSTQKIGDMTDEEIEKIAYSMRVTEGYYSTHKPYEEKWIETTNITVSDGARSVPNYPLRVTLGTQTYEWTTDFFGKLPSIFHTEEGTKIEIKSKNSTGKEEVVYQSTMGNKTKNILLKKNNSQYMASTLLDKPNPPRVKNKPKSITYIIRSDDINLDSIALRYDVSTSELAKDNSIKESTKIYPGQVLVIYDKTGSIIDQSEQTPWSQNGKSYPIPNIPSIESMGGKSKGSALANLPHAQSEAPWMAVAIHEAIQWKGAKAKKIDDNYHKEIELEGSLSGVSWCASFVNYCLKEAGFAFLKSQSSQFPVKSNLFREINQPVYGALMVFRRYLHSNGKWCNGLGHIAFVYGRADNGKIAALGGNQGDTIKLSAYSETEPLTYYSKSMKCYLDVKFYKYYLPVVYNEKYSSELQTFNVDEVNQDFFDKNTRSNDNESVE